MKNNKESRGLIFLGILILIVVFVIGVIGKLLTFIAVVIGLYFIIKGIIKMDKSAKINKSNKKKRR